MPRFLAFVSAALVLSGCGPSEKPFTDNSKDPDLYAKDVKQLTLDAVQRARRSSEPADQVQTIVTEIEGQSANGRPVGSNKPVYDELLVAAKKFVEDAKKADGKPANVSSRLDELKKIADKLPGEVNLQKEPQKKPKDKD